MRLVPSAPPSRNSYIGAPTVSRLSFLNLPLGFFGPLAVYVALLLRRSPMTLNVPSSFRRRHEDDGTRLLFPTVDSPTDANVWEISLSKWGGKLTMSASRPMRPLLPMREQWSLKQMSTEMSLSSLRWAPTTSTMA